MVLITTTVIQNYGPNNNRLIALIQQPMPQHIWILTGTITAFDLLQL
jgi:hypothetical protein